MSSAHLEELVETRTEEGLVLAGLLINPRDQAPHPVLVLWMHGAGVNFYHPSYPRIGREVAARGFAFVTGNNRGHDFGTPLGWVGWNAIRGGLGWEDFADSPRDMAAWVDFAIERGFQGVALIGHSFGGMKVTYYQAQRQDPRVLGIGIASPNLTIGLNAEVLTVAERMVSEGRGEETLPWSSDIDEGGFHTCSASTYVSHSRIPDIFGVSTDEPTIASIQCPIFACYGTEDIGGEAELALMRRHAWNTPRFETRLFEGANHGYDGKEAMAAEAIAEWVRSLR